MKMKIYLFAFLLLFILKKIFFLLCFLKSVFFPLLICFFHYFHFFFARIFVFVSALLISVLQRICILDEFYGFVCDQFVCIHQIRITYGKKSISFDQICILFAVIHKCKRTSILFILPSSCFCFNFSI